MDIYNYKHRELAKQVIVKKLCSLIIKGIPKNISKKKTDNSYVTDVDRYISNYFFENFISKKKNFKNEKSKLNFLSEEVPGNLDFPSMILDPLDGTKELVNGIPECAISLAIYKSKKIENNFGWIFNPFTSFEISTQSPMTRGLLRSISPLVGLVSRTEWEDGLFKNYQSSKFFLYPRGSIAFKLGLLASGACDFVVTLRPKNIWDIAAGTTLCSSRGISLFSEKKQLKGLDDIRINGPLLWCRKEYLRPIKKFLKL